MFYEGKRNPLCHIIQQPKIENEEDKISLDLWLLIKDERLHSESPNTLKSQDIVVICQLYDQPLEIYEKIKFIERIYYNEIVDRFNQQIQEIRNK